VKPRSTSSFRWLLAGVAIALLLVAAARVDWPALDRSTNSNPAAQAPAAEGLHGVFIEPQDGVRPVVDEIDAARSSVDVEVYLLTSDEIIDALKRAKGRGATVRIIIERQPYLSEQDKSFTRSQLEAKGFQVRFGPSRYTYTHAKFIVIDQRVGLVLTANLTFTAFTSNREIGVTTTVPAEVAELQAVFEADWRDEPAPSVATLVLSPTNSRAALSGLVAGANSSIEVYAEEMYDARMVDAFIAAKKRGVTVRVLIPSSSDPDQAALVHRLQSAGVDVRILDKPRVHAKMILVDDVAVYVGSQNMSATSLDHNREVGLILNDPANVARLAKAFQRDFTAAPKAITQN
jgi:phosphatidylserine/phosphatidylglycerophosphate/cardiolipin synthase-like enzyme